MIGVAARAGPRWLPAIALGVACTSQAAPPSDDPLAWLQRATGAARATSYSGTFVHTNGDRISTFRITHFNLAGEEHERIEPLDGPALEIVRKNDEMYCRFPDAKTVRLDTRIAARYFPSILRTTPEAISASYDAKLGKVERILGHECRWMRLEPKDKLRFEQRLCAEMGTGLVMRAKTLNAGQVIEQYTFTELKLGPHAGSPAEVRAAFEARAKQWRKDKEPREDARTADTGWTVTNVPPGFQKVTELKRTLPGRPQPVSQIVLSDGLANVSVFVEPNGPPTRTNEASSEEGTTTFFTLPMGDQLVTVLGEVPLATAQQVGRSVSKRP